MERDPCRWALLSERRYSSPSFCLISVSEEFVLIVEEKSSLILLFDHRFNCRWTKKSEVNIVDLSYSTAWKVFLLLNEKQIFRFDPFREDFSPIDDYQLVKANRSMSSICCSTSDEQTKIYLLYRFGEYLDVYQPHSQSDSNGERKKIWKHRHFCHSTDEEVFLIRSSNHSEPENIRFALLIVELNEIWRVDIYSSRFQRLNEGFRFQRWNRRSYLHGLGEIDGSFIWSVDEQNQLFIDRFGQPTTTNSFVHPPFAHPYFQCQSISSTKNKNKHSILFRVKHSFQLYQLTASSSPTLSSLS